MINYSTPPTNIECEIEVLGAILFNKNAIYDISELLPVDAFFLKAHQEIYKACLALFKQQQEVNLLSVTNYLSVHNLLMEVGGRSKLADLASSTFTCANIRELADILLEKYVRRRLLNLSFEIENKINEAQPLAWTLENIEEQVLKITQLRNTEGDGYWQKIDEVAFNRLCQDLERVEDIENAAQRDWAMRKLAKKWRFSGKKDLLDFHAKWLDSQNVSTTYTAKQYFQKYGQVDQDWVIPGFIPLHSVVVLYAGGGVGKTRLAMGFAKHCVTGGGFPYEGMEIEPMDVLLIETDQGPNSTIKLLEMQDLLNSERLHICDEWSTNEFGKLRSMLKTHQPKLIIIDSLTSISVNSLYSENDTEYARPLVRLRHIAKEFGCSFLVIHHANASGGMRGSTAIKNTVDEVWSFAKQQTDVGTFNTLTIEKTRSRGPGVYKFTYDEETWGWQFGGRAEDENGEQRESTNIMSRCLNFLQERRNTAFEASEIATLLGLNLASVRRDLKRAANEGLVNCGRSARNNKALVYYLGQREVAF